MVKYILVNNRFKTVIREYVYISSLVNLIDTSTKNIAIHDIKGMVTGEIKRYGNTDVVKVARNSIFTVQIYNSLLVRNNLIKPKPIKDQQLSLLGMEGFSGVESSTIKVPLSIKGILSVASCIPLITRVNFFKTMLVKLELKPKSRRRIENAIDKLLNQKIEV